MQDEAYIRIPLRGKTGNIQAYALIDRADAALADHRWHLNNGGYASRGIGRIDGKYRWESLHRCILGLSPSDRREGDHINGDRLDNRRANLRAVTRGQNMQNVAGRNRTSPYRGVSWCKERGRWQAHAMVNRRSRFLGRFDDELEAAAAASLFRLLYMPFSVEERNFPSA